MLAPRAQIRAWLSRLYACFLLVLDWLFVRMAGHRVSGTGTRKRVLILRLDTIGDAVLWLDAARGLPLLFPSEQFELYLLCNQTWLSLARTLSFFDEVLSLDRRQFFVMPFSLLSLLDAVRHLPYRLRFLRFIRQCGFDTVVNTAHSRQLFFCDSIVHASAARERIASRGDLSNMPDWQKRVGDRWYTRLLSSGDQNRMELLRNAEFMRGLGLAEFRCSTPCLPPVRQSLSIPAQPYFVVFPGARVGRRTWPLEFFVEIIRRVSQHDRLTAALCGGPSEMHLAQSIRETLPRLAILDYTGKTDIPQLAELIRAAKFLVSNDTSAVHIAASVSTPCICILGGGHFGRFLPYAVEEGSEAFFPTPVVHRMPCFNCNWKCVYSIPEDAPAPCVSGVSVDAVWEAIREVAARTPPKGSHAG
jgi:ADP-heptose:LPS heptosyltransferase